MRVYAQSKLENSLFTYELARRLEGTGVTVNCVHPGIVRTNLGRDMRGFFRIILTLMWRFMSSPEEGAAAIIHLASSPAVEGVSGKYFGPNKQVLQSPAVAYDEQAARRLWQISAQLTKLDALSV